MVCHLSQVKLCTIHIVMSTALGCTPSDPWVVLEPDPSHGTEEGSGQHLTFESEVLIANDIREMIFLQAFSVAND